MWFLRFFIIAFFFSSAAIALNEQDWIEDRDAISSTLDIYRKHYVIQNLSFEEIKRSAPALVIPELMEVQEACKLFYTLGKFQSQLKETLYGIMQIVKLLEFPYNQRQLISARIASSKSEIAKNICEEALELINMLHHAIQPYFQEDSDRTRSKLGRETTFETYKRIDSDLEFKDYLKHLLEEEKSVFWLPSRQRHADFYNEKIKKLESELSAVKERLSAQKIKKSDEEDHSQRLKESEVQTKEDVTLVEASRVEISPLPTVQASVELVQDLIRGALEEKRSTAAAEGSAVDEEDEAASASGLAALSAESSEYETLQTELALQYERDRAKKLSKKQAAGAAASFLKEEQSTVKTGAAEAEEDIKDHPILKQIFSLDTNLKYEKFLGFLKSLNLRMEDRIGGLSVWFEDEMCKIFHRPHVQGNVVPFIDLKVAKRALKHINITPSFGK